MATILGLALTPRNPMDPKTYEECGRVAYSTYVAREASLGGTWSQYLIVLERMLEEGKSK